MLADSAVSSLILAIICALFISAHFAVVRRFIYSTYDIIAQLSLSLALSVIAILVYSSILASLECFTSQAFAILLLIHTVSIATWIRLKRPVTKVPPAGWDGWHAALILFVLVCYWPAAKIYVGGQDPAVYVAAASSLAHHGKARAPSTAHSLLTPEESQDLLHISADVRHYHWLYNGIFYRSDGTHSYQFDFARGPSYLLAFMWLLVGREHAFLANLIYCLLAISSFYLLARQLLGQGWGFTAAVLLALCPAIIWFGRATYSEIPSLFLVIFTILNFVLYERGLSDRRTELRYLWLACLAAAGSTLLRVDQVTVPTLLIGFMALVHLSPHHNDVYPRSRILFAQILLLGLIYLVMQENHATGPTYIDRVGKDVTIVKYALELAVCGIAVCGLLNFAVVRDLVIKTFATLRTVLFSPVGVVLLSVAVCSLLAWGLAIRPTTEPFQMFGADAHHNAHARKMNEHIFIRLAVLAGLPNLLLCWWGMGREFTRKRVSVATLLFVTLFAGYASVLLIDQRNSPWLYWASRRYLPVIVPAMILFGMSHISRFDLLKTRFAYLTLVSTLLLCSLVPMLWVGRHVIWHREYNGAEQLLKELEARFNRQGTVFVTDAGPRHQNSIIRFPGQFEVLPVWGFDKLSAKQSGMLKTVIKRLQDANQLVVLLTRKPQKSVGFSELSNSPAEVLSYEYERLVPEMMEFPYRSTRDRHQLYYKVVSPSNEI